MIFDRGVANGSQTIFCRVLKGAGVQGEGVTREP